LWKIRCFPEEEGMRAMNAVIAGSAATWRSVRPRWLLWIAASEDLLAMTKETGLQICIAIGPEALRFLGK
jgi:hypothetical protein